MPTNPLSNNPRMSGESWGNYAMRMGVSNDIRNIERLQREELDAIEIRVRMNRVDRATWVGSTNGTPEPLYDDPIANQPPQGSGRPTHERLQSMRTAEAAYRKSLTRSNVQTSSTSGRREQQYVDLIRNEKREAMTAEEIIHTEIPICVSDISDSKFRQIATGVGHNDIKGDGRNTPIELICAKTGISIPREFAYFLAGRVYAIDAMPDLHTCRICTEQKEGCSLIKTFDGNGIMVCGFCLKRNSSCGSCGEKIGAKYVQVRLCATCLNATENTGSTRNFSKGIKWVSKSPGEIMKSPRIFSCEVEGLTPHREWPEQLSNMLPAEMGIATDGSLSSRKARMYGFEVQTPKLAGARGEELVNRMAAVLRNISTTVNQTCGMHIHLDGNGILLANRKAYPAALLQLFKTYIVFEDVILSLLPHNRRRNDYCRPLAETFKLTEIEMLESVIDVEKIWYKERTFHAIHEAKQHHYHASRYFGTNFNSLLSGGHLEIRFHSGTTNPRKILEWANLHALIMDACERLEFDSDFLREAMTTSKLSEKTTMLFDKISLAENSRQYYRSRQKKFGDKKNVDEEVINEVSEPQGRTFSAPRIDVGMFDSLISPQFFIDETINTDDTTEI